MTLYANWALEHHSDRTARAYIRELIAFMDWAHQDPVVARQGWTLFGEPAEARALIEHFLSTQFRYIVSLRPDKHGFDIKRLEPKWGVTRSASHLLSALRSLYRTLINKGRYTHPNPMDGDNAVELIAAERKRANSAFVVINGRLPMPSTSGVDPPQQRRPVASYFRLSRNWEPKALDNPTLRSAILEAGELWGWGLRETCVAKIMFDTGCRIHEGCGLTVGDWQHSKLGRELSCINKGSRGKRTKTLYLQNDTVKSLHTYVEQERLAISGQHLIDLRELPREEAFQTPLFLTARRTALSPDYFRSDFWTPALLKAGLRVRPHQVRHWFVTMALEDIENQPIPLESKEQLRAQLKLLMGWKSDMIPAYDQSIRMLRLPQLAERIHSAIEARQADANSLPPDQPANPKARTAVQSMLDEILENC